MKERADNHIGGSKLNEVIKKTLEQLIHKHMGTDTGVEIYEIVSIQYGKKLQFRMGQKLAEVNLFYGKRGFSVVQSPRCGTSADLNELMSQLIDSFLITEVGYE